MSDARFDMKLPAWLLAEVRRAADDAGMTASEWVRLAMLDRLRRQDCGEEVSDDEEDAENAIHAAPDAGVSPGPKLHRPLPNGRGGFVARFPPAVSDDEAVAALREAHPSGRVVVMRSASGVLAWSEPVAVGAA